MDGAIDFRKLLKEEKKKARQKQRQQARTLANDVNGETDSRPSPSISDIINKTNTNGNAGAKHELFQDLVDPENTVEAIDFDALKQQEIQHAIKCLQEKKLAESWSFAETLQKQHCLCCNPPKISYLPNFMLNHHDQQALMKWLQSLPNNPLKSQNQTSINEQEEEQAANGTWTTMQYAKRRVALFFDSNKSDEQEQPFYRWPVVQRLVQALMDANIFPADQPPNHLLVNEYHAGQGILPHTDGPAYVSRTATLSLGSSVLIQFTPRPNFVAAESHEEIQLLLDPGSLLVFEDSAYLNYCHGIQDRILQEEIPTHCLNMPPDSVNATVNRDYRISLTFRHKLKLSVQDKGK